MDGTQICNYVFPKIQHGISNLNTTQLHTVFLKKLLLLICISSRKEIGLCFKYSKRQLELPGYCKLFDNIWMYSRQALDILKAYVKQFPIMFRQLNANPDENIFNEDALFPPDSR